MNKFTLFLLLMRIIKQSIVVNGSEIKKGEWIDEQSEIIVKYHGK